MNPLPELILLIQQARCVPLRTTPAPWTFGLQSTVKPSNSRVRELIDRIENHPHRDELQPDSMQDNVYNPFIENSKKMIHDKCNAEYFESCEATSKVQCSYCPSYWAKGIVHCTCGNRLCHTEFTRQLNRNRFRCSVDFELTWLKRMRSRSSTWKIWGADLQSPGLQRVESMSKEERCHRSKWHRNSWQFLKDPQSRQSQEEHGWDEAKCEEMDKVAKEDHSYTLTRSDFLRCS